ncbi:MAG: TniB family NTP-binding protein [Longimicrobiales bacterium]
MTIAPPSEPANSASSPAIEHEGGKDGRMGESSDAERIRHVQNPTWIGYTRANRILERMEDLLAHPPTTRMPNLLVVGESGNGKTHLLARFVRRHAAFDHASRSAAAVPVVSILAPPVPEETRFYGSILDYVHAPQRDRDPASAKYRQVINVLRGLGARMLLVDEIQQVLTGPPVKQRIFLNVLKHLSNELQIPIVGAGTEDAFHVIASEPQLARRFMPMTLRRWTPGDDYLRLLVSFSSRLPLRRPSTLTDPAVSERILALSEGTIGEIASLIALAAAEAIRSGHECIDAALLDRIDWTAPSARKWKPEA